MVKSTILFSSTFERICILHINSLIKYLSLEMAKLASREPNIVSRSYSRTLCQRGLREKGIEIENGREIEKEIEIEKARGMILER